MRLTKCKRNVCNIINFELTEIIRIVQNTSEYTLYYLKN